MKKHIYPLLAVLALSCLSVAQAARDRDPADPFHDWKGENETGVFSYDDSKDKPWQESVTDMPRLPPDEDLLAVRVDDLPAPMQAFIGAESLAFDPQDRVLRYWLVIKSPQGAYNATYEGLRCATAEYKVYAYGNPRRIPPVQAAPNATWRPVGIRRAGGYRPEMMRTLLCSEANRPRQLGEILDTLRGRAPYRNPSANNTDF